MKKCTIAIIMIAALSACTTSQSLYSWHGYEDATYRYSKEATDGRLAKVVEQYQKMLNDQRGSRGTVPPGLCAEYGYLLCKTGKKDEGLKYLRQEIALYPESEKYISRIIKQLEK